MKHPFWLVNDLLLIILLTVIGFMFISQQKEPAKASLTSQAEIKLPKKAVSKIDLSKIYNNDLFETYKAPLAPEETAALPKITMPEPPSPKPVKVPLALPPKFLEPLQITLKGIISLSDETENIAIIQDTKNSTTKNYHVGSKIEDAQLIRILSNKIILVRSNGQQETLYVNQHDAELDQQMQSRTNWSSVVQQKSSNNYLVDPATFIEVIPNLSELIDKINLVTVYKKGRNVGCRVGLLQPKSIGTALGLQPGDVIESINKVPATTTDSRFEIYQKIIGMNLGDTITINLLRNQTEVVITYTLQQLEEPFPSLAPKVIGKEKSLEEIEAENKELLRQKQQFAPTLEQLRMQQKRDIVNYGNRNRRNFNVLSSQP
jgi:type II secretory pathway component PulC